MSQKKEPGRNVKTGFRTSISSTGAAKAEKAAQPLPGAPPRVQTHEEVIISRIMKNESTRLVSENSLLFSSVMSNLTAGLGTLSRRHGSHIGRLIFYDISKEKHYIWYEETVSDLIKFFERSGYRDITYNVFPEMVNIQIHDKPHVNLGINLHSFEAGIMSGFLTAATGRYILMEELECSCNGSDHCAFSTAHAKASYYNQERAKMAVNLFASHIIRQLDKSDKREPVKAAQEYYTISSHTMLDRGYSEEMEKMAYYIGSKVGYGLFSGKAREAPDKAFLESLSELIKLLNLGEPNFKRTKPLSMNVDFGSSHSRSEMVSISLSLIRGFIETKQFGDISAAKEVRGGSYRLSISENRKGNK